MFLDATDSAKPSNKDDDSRGMEKHDIPSTLNTKPSFETPKRSAILSNKGRSVPHRRTSSSKFLTEKQQFQSTYIIHISQFAQ